MTLRVVELFAGIGAQRMALTLAGIPHEVVAIAEINKHSLASYNAIYGDCPNLGDITKVEKLPLCDLVTYSFPCQDLSLAGKRAGMGEGTRSGLVWEVVRLLESAERERPEWLLMENVPQVLTAPEWPALVRRLEAMGYRSKWAKLDSSNFGSAQKRVRAFMVSRLDQEPPDLPTSAPNAPRLCLRDIMEPERAERYVRRIPWDMVKWRTPKTEPGESTPAASIDGETFYSKAMLYSSSSPTVRTEHGRNSQIKVVDRRLSVVGEDLSEGQWKPHRLILDESGPARAVIENVNACTKSIKVVADWQRRGMDQANRLYSSSSSSPAIMCHGGGKRDVKVVDESEIKVFGCRDDEGRIDQNIVPSRTFLNRHHYEGGGLAPCVTVKEAKDIKVAEDIEGSWPQYTLTVSILTPRECWRLMGFPEWAYLRASRVSSETQLYNQAGNSIVVEVLIAIFNAMFRPQKYRIQTRITEATA